MRVLLAVLVLLLLVAASMGTWWNISATSASEEQPGGSAAVRTPNVGDRAMAFKLRDAAGRSYSLTDLQDKKVVLLSFASVTCPVCKESAPAHQRIYEKFRGNAEFAMWGLYGNAPDRKALRKYARDNKLRYPLLLDQKAKVRAAYGAEETPTLVLVGKDGKVRAVFSGWSDDTEKLLIAQIEDALASEPTAPPPAELMPGRG